MSGTGLPVAILLLLPTLIAGYLGLHAWHRRTTVGASAFAALMFITASWAFTAAMVVVSPDPAQARIWINLMFASVPFLPVCLLATVAQTVGRPSLVRPPRLLLWLIIPTITATLSLTSGLHNIYYFDVQFIPSGAQNIGWTNRFGGWAVIHLSYSYIVILYGVVLLGQQYIRMRFRTYRMRILLLLVGALLPFLANIYGTLFTDTHYFITPMMFNVSAPALFWAVFRYRLFELLPIARDQAFEHMDDAIIITDQENQIVDVNPSAASLAGQNASSLIGKSLFGIFPAYQNAFVQASESHQSIQIDTDNQQHFDLRITPITRDQEQVGQLIVLRDVTEQRLAEARARHMETERERIQTLAQFIEAASHEFRTPLTIIKNAAFLISRTDDSAKREDKSAQIDEEVNRLSQLVDALLTVARLNAQFEMTFQTLDVNAMIHIVEQKLRPEASAKSLHVQMNLAPDLPPIRGNPTYLQDAIYAVLHNAVRYTPDGGTITVTTDQPDDHLSLTVQDTGIGIAPEHLPHIFDIFYRVDKARTTAGFGTGLAIASRVIALHGGSIQASSELAVGTTIHMTFPLLNSLAGTVR